MFNDLRLKALHKCDQTSEKGVIMHLKYGSVQDYCSDVIESKSYDHEFMVVLITWEMAQVMLAILGLYNQS